MQLYLYDFAAIDDWADRRRRPLRQRRDDRSFWKDPQMTSFLVRVDGVLAGFVLVRDRRATSRARARGTSASSSSCDATAGGASRTEVARGVFDRYPGKWEVSQLTRSVDAQAFWRRVIGTHTGGRYDEAAAPRRTRASCSGFDNGRR